MSACPRIEHLIVLPRLRVQNANAVSSPLTHGFPSMTAFIGLMWALERKARALGMDVAFDAVGAICHDHEEQITGDGFVHAFRLTRNPIDRNGSTAAIVEEGRIHLDVSLAFAVRSPRWYLEPEAREIDVAKIATLVACMRIAGGTLLPPTHPEWRRYRPYVVDLTGSEDDRRIAFARERLRWLPGFVLVARDDLLEMRTAELRQLNAAANPLDAWLSLARINWSCRSSPEDGRAEWVNDRRGAGWIVPIPVGYGALGEVQAPGRVANARDTTTPFRFVESLYSVGEWISPHRLKLPEHLLWYADSRPEQGSYRCRNDYQTPRDSAAYVSDFD